jgi:hypothetical protein
MLARRVAALPLFLLGGAIWLAAAAAIVVASLYYEYVGLRMMFADGQIVEGLFVAGIVPMVAGFVLSILALPGHGLLALAAVLWGENRQDESGDDPTRYEWDSATVTDGHGTGRSEDDEPEVERFPCPTCGKRLRTPSGLEQHLAIKHPGPLTPTPVP